MGDLSGWRTTTWTSASYGWAEGWAQTFTAFGHPEDPEGSLFLDCFNLGRPQKMVMWYPNRQIFIRDMVFHFPIQNTIELFTLHLRWWESVHPCWISSKRCESSYTSTKARCLGWNSTHRLRMQCFNETGKFDTIHELMEIKVWWGPLCLRQSTRHTFQWSVATFAKIAGCRTFMWITFWESHVHRTLMVDTALSRKLFSVRTAQR